MEHKVKTPVQMFLSQLNDPMIYILINAFVGMIQEGKAQRALDALKKLSSPTALVKRDAEPKEISSSELVLGDLVIYKLQ